MLCIRNLDAFYGDIQALRNVSLHISPGELVALIGGNGAGKSTILNCISRIVTSVSGTLEFGDMDLTSMRYDRVAASGIVHVPEARCVFHDMSVADNLVLGAYSKNGDSSGIKRMMDDVCALFPVLCRKKKQMAGTLSGGEQQMLAIGRGLMARPEILLLDEPSMGLSPIASEEIFKILRKLKESGTTILLVEQNARKALDIADRAYVIETGCIVLEGDTDELKKNHEIKRAYLGKGYNEIWD